ncbi:hypothetical protein D9M68_841900 [compost metagenome]
MALFHPPSVRGLMELLHPTSMAAELRPGTALVGASLLAIPNDPAIAVSPAGMDDRQQAGSYRFGTLAICGSDSTIDVESRANGG